MGRSEILTTVAEAVAQLGVPATLSDEGEWAVAVPCAVRGEIPVIVGTRERTVRLSAFLMRRADRNHAEVYRRLLSRNLRTWLWRFALDDDGDLFAVADLPAAAVADGLLDEALGALSVLIDESYETTIRAGFDVPPGTRIGPPPGSATT